MTLMIRFRCTECGSEQDIDLDDRKLTHIVCNNPECGHYATRPDDELASELRGDTKTSLIMNMLTVVLVIVFFGGIAAGLTSTWPDGDGNVAVEFGTTAFIGFGAAVVAMVGFILTQVKANWADTTCEY